MTQSILEAHSLDVEFVKRFLASLPKHITNRPVPEPPLKVQDIREGIVLETDKYRVTAREVAHLNLLDFKHSSYGYRVDSDYGSVALSGDTEPCDSMIELAKGVDLLIHECTFLEDIIQQREMRGHSGPRGAGKVARKAGAKKLVLTHLGPYDSVPAAVEMAYMYYGPRRGPEVWSQILREAAKEFDGPIILGEDALVLEVCRGA
jgi:ribonuclease Z